MNQDTRKDRRVKIVSLNVRYKSATVDEFIENHAHDVSRGGIYIKTANPFPPGTLLKFEIRLASDQAVIAGVGRVVWKRDAGTSNGERPAGMGVKFIKIDEPSKTVIDRLVNTKPDAGKAFESEAEMPTAVLESPAAKIIPPTATTKLTPPAGVPGALPARKATMMGLGIPTGSSPPPADTPSKPKVAAATPAQAAPRPASTGGGGMFPSSASTSEAEMPPKQEQTVMKQAAELLEEALREAGGSMDEIGHNPLFSGTSPTAPAVKESVPPAASEGVTTPAEVAEVKGPSPTEKKKSSMPPVEVKTPSVEVSGSTKAKDADDAAKARAMVAGMAPAPKRGLSEPPRTTRESPSAKAVPQAEPAAHSAAKKGGSGAFILLFVLVAAAAGAVVMYRDRLFGSDVAPEPTTSATATTTTSAPSASAPPVDSAAASAAASATAAPSASVAPSASAAMAPSATPSATATAKPTATSVPTSTTTAAAATAAPTATATAAPKPTATATATAAATEAPTVAPKPKPKPKPADDNPY